MNDLESSGNDMVLLSNKRIGELVISVLISENHDDKLTITDHPVHRGASISDHAYMMPRKVTLQCGWSNADYAALEGAPVSGSGNGLPTSAQYVDGVYNQLLNLQRSAQPFELVTSRRRYENMLIESLSVTHDATTSGALRVTAGLREVIIVDTSESVLPPPASQADQKSTAQTQRKSTKSPVPAPVPAPAPSYGPTPWPATQIA